MNLSDLDGLKYPIGEYEAPAAFSGKLKEQWLTDLKFLPNALEAAIHNLDEEHLKTPYRPGGWTVNQLVHHVADSHMNAYIRFKLGYTEENPTIRPYEEKSWAMTTDVQQLPVNVSITLLFALHLRWHEFLKSFSEADWQRTVYHPEHKKQLTLFSLLGMYAWHGRHHTAHITALRESKGW
ncbi:MAG TPA: putative metal-dependent hydrolase [Flavisolibacter sp.]|nr:putative metal-dependent hydrolase [Flavisolibacter sp.]